MVHVRTDSDVMVESIVEEDHEWESMTEEQWMERSDRLHLGNQIVRFHFSSTPLRPLSNTF